MRFLIDENVPISLAAALVERGHDVRLLEPSQRAAPDGALLELAAGARRILVTLDKDFGDLVFLTPAAVPPAVVLVRLGPVELAARRTVVVAAIERHALPGSFVVITRETVRVRPLPAP